jgi:hypothetical protein
VWCMGSAVVRCVAYHAVGVQCSGPRNAWDHAHMHSHHMQAFWAGRYMGALALTLNPRTRKLTGVNGRVLLLGGLGSAEPVMPDPQVRGR